jgi:hypothetical protein
MQMPSVPLPAENNRPDKKSQPHQKKSAEINKDLSETGSGGKQRPKRILLIHPEGAGQKTCSNHKTVCPARTNWSLLAVVTPIFNTASRKPDWRQFSTARRS